MERDGIEQVLILPFDERISLLDPTGFFREILVDSLGARALAVGHNFLFGRNQSGNASTLLELGRPSSACASRLSPPYAAAA